MFEGSQNCQSTANHYIALSQGGHLSRSSLCNGELDISSKNKISVAVGGWGRGVLPPSSSLSLIKQRWCPSEFLNHILDCVLFTSLVTHAQSLNQLAVGRRFILPFHFSFLSADRHTSTDISLSEIRWIPFFLWIPFC